MSVGTVSVLNVPLVLKFLYLSPRRQLAEPFDKTNPWCVLMNLNAAAFERVVRNRGDFITHNSQTQSSGQSC